jgi:ectoine hydroxylase-related dioxygenase (phytanoyl-CoA dioxygenase family)
MSLNCYCTHRRIFLLNLTSGSHAKAVHKKFDSRKTEDEVLTGSPHVLSTLQQGDMAVYDSRVLHCGTSNRSQKERILLYVTFKNPDGPKSDSDFWNVASIRPELVGQCRLGDFL